MYPSGTIGKTNLGWLRQRLIRDDKCSTGKDELYGSAMLFHMECLSFSVEVYFLNAELQTKVHNSFDTKAALHFLVSFIS